MIMKIILVCLFVLIGMSACSTHQDNGYYDRANLASEKALDKLDKE